MERTGYHGVLFDSAFFFHALAEEKHGALVRDLLAHQCQVYDVDLGRVEDRDELLVRLSTGIPASDGQAYRSSNWDNLNDRLWHRLFEQPYEEVAILLNASESFVALRLPLFLELMDFFQRLCSTLRHNPCRPDARSVCVRVVLLGPGLGYPADW